MHGHVYLIGSRQYHWFKIGKSRNASIRIADLSILLPFRVEVIAVWTSPAYHDLERQLHKRLSKNRINGEWFNLTEDELAAIVVDMRHMSAGVEIPIQFRNLQNTQQENLYKIPAIRDDEKMTRTKEWREFAKARKGLPRAETNKWKAELLAHQRCRVKHLEFFEKIHLTYWQKQLYF